MQVAFSELYVLWQSQQNTHICWGSRAFFSSSQVDRAKLGHNVNNLQMTTYKGTMKAAQANVSQICFPAVISQGSYHHVCSATFHSIEGSRTAFKVTTRIFFPPIEFS